MSAGMLWIMGNMMGLVIINVSQALAQPDTRSSDTEECSPNSGGDMTYSMWFITACTALGCLFVMLFRSTYRRATAEELETVVDDAVSQPSVSEGN